jgi:hypothetical protein
MRSGQLRNSRRVAWTAFVQVLRVNYAGMKLRKVRRNMSQNQECGQHFKDWVEDLEHEPGLWSAREMDTDVWFRNAELRAFIGSAKAAKVDWETASCRLLNGSRKVVEDVHARVLRNKGTTEAFEATIHGCCGQACAVRGSATASFCERCKKGCAVIVQRIWPLN